MGRRAFIASGLGLCAAPLVALAQQAGKVARIGMLLPNTPEIAARSPRNAAFLKGLRDLGWIEGQNLAIEWRFADGQLGRLAELAADLARIGVDAIVTAAAPSALAAQGATRTIPIVVLDPGDPVGLGLVASLARPGGNITGVSSIAPELAAKRLALLKETVPAMGRVAVLSNAAIRRRNRDAGTGSGGKGPRCADPIGSDPGRQGYRAGVRRSCAPACRWNSRFPRSANVLE
jgi:putative ABC transport system substrate-binding protein